MSPLPFAPPRPADAPFVRQAVGAAQQSDLAFANIYLLRHKYGTDIALEDGVLYRHFSGQGRLQGYAFPRGAPNPAAALKRVEEDARLRSRPFRFCLLLEDELRLLESLYTGRFRITCDRGDADYLYERTQLAELPGARFHRKRNHLARFQRECPAWKLEPLSMLNASDALAVASGWLAGMVAEGQAASPALLHEHEAIAHALELLEPLSLFGAVLYVDAQPVGMSVASQISAEVANVHYEKCLPSFRSAYPLLNQGMASMLSCTWLNREEDLNQPGLRQAKLSYFPSVILQKYSALPC